MARRRQVLFFILLVSSCIFLLNSMTAAEEFSKERAMEHLRVLAGTIGPRPMGSPQENAALMYFAVKLAKYGCKVEWQPVKESKGMLGLGARNTDSYNVIGKLPGQDKREIIMGAHIDSSTPEIPGADDDGSGVAAVLEAARVMSQEPHQATLVFVAFCGEESGLVGSKAFVEQYPLENVALMLQLDMTSNDSPLLLFIETTKSQSPPWLVSASIDAFHALGYRNIDYPTFFQSLNSAFGGAGSDHEPFLDKGIPAIAFVTDLTFPIHTPNDSLEYFEPAGIERSGRLIVELARKFDRGQPDEKSGRYMLILAGEKPFYIPLLWIKIIVLLSLVLAFFTLVRLYLIRKSQIDWEEDKKVKKSWPKLLIFNVIIIVVMFSSLWLMQLASGQRTPWYAHPAPYLLFGFLFFIFGLWLSLQITGGWKLRKNSFFYFIRASIYLAVLVILSWVTSGPRLALFPAAGLFFLSLACLVPWGWLKGLLWLLAPYWLFRLLVLSEYYEFPLRESAPGFVEIKIFILTLIFWSVLVLFFLLWTMPFLLGFAAVYRSSSRDLFWMKLFRRRIALIPLAILIVGGALYLKSLAAFQVPWEQEIRVVQRLDADNKTSIEFESGGYLRGIKANINGKEEVIDVKSSSKKIDLPLEMNWLKEKVDSQVEDKGAEKLAELKFQLDFEKQPYAVTLNLKADKSFKIEAANFKYRHKKKRATITWFSYPPQSLRPELKLSLPKQAKLEANISATFLETPLEVTGEAKNAYFVHRAEIKRKIEIIK